MRSAAPRRGDRLRIPTPSATFDGPKQQILWVSRQVTIADRLDISAQQMDGAMAVGDPVKQSVAGGPGPSIVDLPAAGCWRFTVTWADRTDSLDLEYVTSST